MTLTFEVEVLLNAMYHMSLKMFSSRERPVHDINRG